MHIWIMMVSLLTTPNFSQGPGMSPDDSPEQEMRYRGIETLLAKFDAEAEE